LRNISASMHETIVWFTSACVGQISFK
jgi:hypothetical protein